jgi:hypothetical protein
MKKQTLLTVLQFIVTAENTAHYKSNPSLYKIKAVNY